jgi:hypothetical protein
MPGEYVSPIFNLHDLNEILLFYVFLRIRSGSDTKRILDVDATLEKKIEEIIKSRGYRDFHHFATVALENQVAWEAGGALDTSILKSVKAADSNLLKMASSEPLLMDPPSPENLTNKILWGQYYRFLPCKVGVRVLSNIYTKQPPDIHDFIDTVNSIAVQLRNQFSKLDRIDRRAFGERLAASFPTNDEKSTKRFANQYMVYLRTGDMKLVGMMPDLKFVNIKIQEDGSAKIGLTKFGFQFAVLQNPVIDQNKPESLSKQEIEFLLNHITKNLPEELEHTAVALQAIKEGKKTRENLNQVLRTYYTRYHGAAKWSDAVINTMRSGLLSRLNELRLVRREKRGKNVYYHVTTEGKKYLESVQYV